MKAALAPGAILANVPETSGYRLIYKLAIPSATPQWNNNTRSEEHTSELQSQ